MNKREKMKELTKKYEEVQTRCIADLFAATDESSDAFNAMWDFARENGFVNNGVISDFQSTEIYKNYGCLSAEKRNVYTYGNPEATAKCYDVITIKIPDGWETYESIAGETILVAPSGKNYTFREVLCGDEYPCFRALENKERIRLEVI